jgi:hypothetical protein
LPGGSVPLAVVIHRGTVANAGLGLRITSTTGRILSVACSLMSIRYESTGYVYYLGLAGSIRSDQIPVVVMVQLPNSPQGKWFDAPPLHSCVGAQKGCV